MARPGDRGRIAPGLRPDRARVRAHERPPVARRVRRVGEKVA